MPSPDPWVLQIDPIVLKTLERIPKNVAAKILHAIRELPLDPFAGDIQKLKGQEDVWRRRIGSYRVFYKLITAERAILVFHLERRTSRTY